MKQEAFENSLVEEVRALGIATFPYPQNPKNYYPESDPGEVLVRYEGQKPLARDIAGQAAELLMHAEIVVVSRKLRGEDGAYSWLDKIKNSLEGKTIDGATAPMFLQVESFLDEKDGLWQFGQKWAMAITKETTYTDEYEGSVTD